MSELPKDVSKWAQTTFTDKSVIEVIGKFTGIQMLELIEEKNAAFFNPLFSDDVQSIQSEFPS